jgi:glycosyltransferase involved in cell wall biosynthesis
MRIAIDAHHIGNQRAGTETYVYNLVRNLALLEPNGERYALYLNPRKSVCGVDSNGLFETRNIPSTITPIRYGLFYPAQSWRKRFDVFHAQHSLPPFLRCRAVLTVHDLCYERFPEFFQPRVRRQMKLLVPWSCKRADHIITVSESSKRDLVEIYRLDPTKITVTHEAAGDNFSPAAPERAAERLREGYGVQPPFLLYVGNLDPRKNLARLLRAFAQLRQNGRIQAKLVIVGQKSWLHDAVFQAIRQHSLGEEVILTGYVPAADLPLFYSAASVMVYPSIYEGFGLPVVEAMACGTPVITSRGSSLEEIASDAAILIDPYSIAEIAGAIEKVVNDSCLQKRMRALGLRRAAQFSYQRMAEATRSVYHQL